MTHPRKAVSALSMRLLYMAMAAALISGCATIMNRERNSGVRIESDPSGAEVFVDNVKAGITPVDLRIAGTAGVHRIRLCMDGYRDVEVEVTKRMDPWVWGNVPLAVFPVAALSGLAIDAYSGKWFRYDPSQIPGKLEPVDGSQGSYTPFVTGHGGDSPGMQPAGTSPTPGHSENVNHTPPSGGLIEDFLKGNIK